MPGTLYLVAVPIGNRDDITSRALRILREADVIVCEEPREGRRLLHHYDLSEKTIEELNEHNDEEASSRILSLLEDGKNIALISDAGTPLFADPGDTIVTLAIERGITIIPIPGPSSLLPALIVSGFPINEFVFHGFLSPKNDIRKKELHKLKYENRTIVLLEAPYRLVPLLADMAKAFGSDRDVCIAFNLSMDDEQIFRGTSVELYQRFAENKIKGEFVIVIGSDRKKKEDPELESLSDN
jgi:16S rRNA (cytidine1402-2'-O)-methyltransferase